MTGKALIIGHRGASRDAPENTLASFRLAFEQGAHGIEADFRLTRDGEIVCLHDDRTSRTAGGDLAVAQSSLDELRRLDAGGWKGERWCGERIPTLKEVLDSLPPDRRLFIEVKCGAEIVAPLAAVLSAASVQPDRIRLLAFSADLILAIKERLPQWRACWLTDYRFRAGWRPSPGEVLETLRRIGADGLASRSRSVLDRDFVAALRDDSREIHVWTVDALPEARRLVALGVDSIMTNRPAFLLAGLKRDAVRPGEPA